MSIKITNPGMQTTLQDAGRWGYQNVGMTVAGAMDLFALRCANILVGNDQNEACLEVLMMGPTIEFDEDETIAVTGGNLSPMLNGQPINNWESIEVKKSDKLSFKGKKSGLRCYIAFSKTIDVPVIMGSKSTFLRGNLGGFEGRKLAKGDELKLGSKAQAKAGKKIDEKYIPTYKKEDTIRFVFGPQDDAFTDEAKETIQKNPYAITAESDRMGYRLDGEKITHKDSADIISDGIVFGSIQVPSHGSPIVMMGDRQTTGGYTKIGTVITPDLSILAQMDPGCKVQFKAISVEEAQKIYEEYETAFEQIKNSLVEVAQSVDAQPSYAASEKASPVSAPKVNAPATNMKFGENSYTTSFNGTTYNITVKQVF